MRPDADFLVYDRYDQLVLAVETHPRLNYSTEDAIFFRNYLMTYDLISNTKFFLLATPERFFIWKNDEETSSTDAPTLVVDSKPFFKNYFEGSKIEPEQISRSSFEFFVNGWLSEILYAGITDELVEQLYPWLSRIGLFELIRDGRVRREELAFA